jgi:hypothetical protein
MTTIRIMSGTTVERELPDPVYALSNDNQGIGTVHLPHDPMHSIGQVRRVDVDYDGEGPEPVHRILKAKLEAVTEGVAMWRGPMIEAAE